MYRFGYWAISNSAYDSCGSRFSKWPTAVNVMINIFFTGEEFRWMTIYQYTSNNGQWMYDVLLCVLLVVWPLCVWPTDSLLFQVAGFQSHFAGEVYNYGKQVIVNLLDQGGQEKQLFSTFTDVTEKSHNPNIRWHSSGGGPEFSFLILDARSLAIASRARHF